MKLLRYSCASLAIVLGFITIIASNYTITAGFVDSDGDGYGNPLSFCGSIEQPNCVENNTDCDDTAIGVNPGTGETCDGIDTDCDGDAWPDCDLGAYDSCCGPDCTTLDDLDC